MRRTCSSSSADSDQYSPVNRRKRSSSTPSSAKNNGTRKSASESMKLVVVGDRGVGKSALTVRLLTRRFIGNYQNDKDMLYKSNQISKLDMESDKKMRLEILDITSANLSDEENNHPVIERLFWSTAAVIVYDITSHRSFQYASDILKDIKGEKSNHTCLLLGNKTDLEHERVIKISEVTDLMTKYSNCQHAEVSAASTDYENLIDIFQNLFTLSRSVTPKPLIKRRRSIVDMARAFSTLLRSGSTKSSEAKTSL